MTKDEVVSEEQAEASMCQGNGNAAAAWLVSPLTGSWVWVSVEASSHFPVGNGSSPVGTKTGQS
ncbi:hypothetical protein PIB30_002123 [Stylosanthes scabra]|uniref:Uncharacterized protein n=1 Tax=Stylosanthes scabra TaxID=79078 RepID=A0ABU6R3I0_9FABA|nr:hypothetical protein [Stylosanthes scabra]